jgi:site-specific recombinase
MSVCRGASAATAAAIATTVPDAERCSAVNQYAQLLLKIVRSAAVAFMLLLLGRHQLQLPHKCKGSHAYEPT